MTRQCDSPGCTKQATEKRGEYWYCKECHKKISDEAMKRYLRNSKSNALKAWFMV